MTALWREFRAFLRERWGWWGGVLLIVFGTLGWLAWTTAQVPENPFTYQTG
jgi:hypothetical protein